MMKFAHQFQPGVILPDDYVSWFFNHSIAKSLQEDILGLSAEPTNDVERFLQVAYWHIILREKFSDEVIADAIAVGCQQLVLLGAGYDTRFFRIVTVQEKAIATFEVDLSN